MAWLVERAWALQLVGRGGGGFFLYYVRWVVLWWLDAKWGGLSKPCPVKSRGFL